MVRGLAISEARERLEASSCFCHNLPNMWDAFTRFFSHLLTFSWFAGAALMLLTIPACVYKIFSALWEDSDSAEEEQGVYDTPGKRSTGFPSP